MKIDAVWFYVVLGLSTLAIGILARALYLRTRSISIFVGIGALYFWSLYGGWFITFDQSGGDTGLTYLYLFTELYPIYLDVNYLLTLFAYSFFIITIEVVMLLMFKPTPDIAAEPIVVSPYKLVAVAIIVGMMSYGFVRSGIQEAAELDISVYAYTRRPGVIEFFTLHQICNRTALVAIAIGIAVYASGTDARYLVCTRTRHALLGLLAVSAAMICFCFLLGNKNELLFTGTSGVLLYLANARKPRYAWIGLMFVVTLFAFGLLDFARSWSLNEVGEQMSGGGGMISSVLRIVTSHEAFAAHMSLYGILDSDVPLTYGSSFVSISASLIPRYFWPDRPDDIYTYYIQRVGTPGEQGFTIHHAGAWYLNFGWIGLVAGAVLWGCLWAMAYRNFQVSGHRKSLQTRVFAILAFSMFTADFPMIVRNGPEGYKSVFIDVVFIPMVVMFLSARMTKPNPDLALSAVKSVP